ncbi:MAG: class I SAM-dependent methyltransferase [Rhodospirillales bacterium]|nr:class I SAM-dependent methyltransferase [Rhodospirillales bacterium]MBO6787272.1 class I SAM-dependent methyltransferase [Rhodospirillales bacterium]
MIIQILRRAPKLLAPVARIYGHRLDQCGATAKGVFWKGEVWQRRRFERLIEIFEPDDMATGGITINDLGCGYGAFFEYLRDYPVLNGSRYYGYDISQAMIAACRDRIVDPRASFHRKMWASKPAEYGFASGTYNLHGKADDDQWWEYVEASLRQLWHRTGKALAFNMLRIDEDEQFEGLYYVDPEKVLRFCRKYLSEDVEMFDERPMPDVTFFVRR